MLGILAPFYRVFFLDDDAAAIGPTWRRRNGWPSARFYEVAEEWKAYEDGVERVRCEDCSPT